MHREDHQPSEDNNENEVINVEELPEVTSDIEEDNTPKE